MSLITISYWFTSSSVISIKPPRKRAASASRPVDVTKFRPISSLRAIPPNQDMTWELMARLARPCTPSLSPQSRVSAQKMSKPSSYPFRFLILSDKFVPSVSSYRPCANSPILIIQQTSYWLSFVAEQCLPMRCPQNILASRRRPAYSDASGPDCLLAAHHFAHVFFFTYASIANGRIYALLPN